MALIGANELKRKMLITIENQPYAVLDVFFASPSARGASTMVRTKLRNLITDAVMEKSFRTNEKFEEPDVILTPASFLYSDGENCHFMDEGTYEQFALAEKQLGDDRLYLKDGILLQVLKYNSAPIAIQLPPFVKPATLETGLQVRVPLFIKDGEVVRVSTQTGEFVSRA
jgi:elongation factor P